jgi:hypothetical protein
MMTSALVMAVGNLASAEPPTNAKLLSSLPADAESVAAIRFDAMTAEGSAFKSCFEEWLSDFGDGKDEDLPTDMGDIVAAAVVKATPIVLAVAGSGFQFSKGLGLGRYDRSVLAVVKDAITDLSGKLDEGDGRAMVQQRFEFEGVPVWSGEITLSMDDEDRMSRRRGERRLQRFFVALVDDHTLGTAYAREHIEEMIRRFRSNEPPELGRWKELTTIKPESPLVIYREFDKTNPYDYMSPANPNQPEHRRADIKQMGIVLPDPARPVLTLHVITPEPEQAASALWFSIFPAWLDRDKEVGEGGFVATLTAKPDQASDLPFLLMLAFGLNIMI